MLDIYPILTYINSIALLVTTAKKTQINGIDNTYFVVVLLIPDPMWQSRTKAHAIGSGISYYDCENKH